MDDRDKIKERVIKRALIHVPFDGWSQAVLERATVEAELDPSYAWRLFPRGPLDAVSLWSHLLDREMEQNLPSDSDLRIRDKITLAVQTRLSLLTPYREAARKTATFLSLPHHLTTASRLVYRTVNDIWYYAGDTSTDYNFYTKRALLAWVYSSTFVYWLQDDSEQCEKTWRFLDRRIEEVLGLPQLPKKILRRLRL